MACPYRPCDRYRSANSVQASASVDAKSRNCTRASIDSAGLPIARSSAILLFAIGCFRQFQSCLAVRICGMLTMLVLFSAKIASYSFNTLSSSPSLVASASFTRPLKASMRSSLPPNRSTNLSRHSCAVVLSPVRRQASKRFSYIVHVFELSAEENIDRKGDAE